ncbi:MAG: helix-turn-helix domain-containing protein [Lacipirellulaceae bacterium]
MSQKFLSLDEAAEKLGITKERLGELREEGVLNGYRDGPSWKFRTEVVERLVEEGLPQPETASDDLDLDLGGMAGLPIGDDTVQLGIEPLGDGDDAESILMSEADLPGGLPRPPSTIIGRSELGLDDSDLPMAKPESVPSAASAPIEVSPAAFDDLEELELDLEAESSRILDAGDVEAAQRAAKGMAAAAADSGSLGLGNELELDIVGSSVTGGSRSPDSDAMGVLGSDSDPANLTDPGATGALPPMKPAAGRATGFDAVELGADDDDDDLVLGDSGDLALASGSGSGMLASGDSGINLRPSDSGISLGDMQLDLAGSAMGSALDLAALSAKSQGGSVIGEDAFLLTPADAIDSDEDSSQVVALDDLSEDGAPVAFEEDDTPVGFGADEDLEGDFASGFAGAAAGAPVVAASGVTTFPTWIMVLLGCTMTSMALCGMMALDLLHSMWSWDEPYAVNSALMDAVLSIFG